MWWMQGTSLNRTGHPSRILTNKIPPGGTGNIEVLFKNTLRVGVYYTDEPLGCIGRKYREGGLTQF